MDPTYTGYFLLEFGIKGRSRLRRIRSNTSVEYMRCPITNQRIASTMPPSKAKVNQNKNCRMVKDRKFNSSVSTRTVLTYFSLLVSITYFLWRQDAVSSYWCFNVRNNFVMRYFEKNHETKVPYLMEWLTKKNFGDPMDDWAVHASFFKTGIYILNLRTDSDLHITTTSDFHSSLWFLYG